MYIAILKLVYIAKYLNVRPGKCCSFTGSFKTNSMAVFFALGLFLYTSVSVVAAQSATSVSTATSSSTSSAESPTVSIAGYGTVQGNRSQYVSSVYNFKGVPYASAPTGAYRWKHPPHPIPWNDTRDATQFSLPCPQPGVANYSEDCLYLNIWTPEDATFNDVYANSAGPGVLPNATSSQYPVYVW